MPVFDSFKSLSARRQIALAGGVMLALCVLLFTVYFVYLRPNYGVLFSKLRTPDAAAIVADLDHKKIPYKITDGGATILVPDGAIDATRLAIMGEDLPIKGVTGFELFNKSDMGLTEFAQKINYQRALQGELARTIMSLEGVESARVHLALTEPTIFKADRIPPKASVTVTMHPGAALSGPAVRGIQRLVASSVPELDIAEVTILDEHGAVVSPDVMSAAVPTSAYGQEKQAIETYHAARIKEALEHNYPHDFVGVTVGTDIDLQRAVPGGATDDVPILAGSGRNRRLLITLTPHTAVSDSVRDDIRSIAATAIGFDPSLGDIITFGPPPQAALPIDTGRMTLTAPTAQRPEPAAQMTSDVRPSLPSDLWLAVIAAAIALFGLVFWRRGVSRSRMIRRQTYVEQLNRLLEHGERDVIPRP
jgi:flagellar M-ring protein FliF